MDTASHLTILSTDGGCVEVDRHKNRLYVKFKDKSEGSPDSSQILEELHELKYCLSHGFTVLFDMHQGKFHHEKKPELLCDVMDLFLEGGLSKLAEVYADSPKRELYPEECNDRLDVDVLHAVFATREEAEAWLDS